MEFDLLPECLSISGATRTSRFRRRVLDLRLTFQVWLLLVEQEDHYRDEDGEPEDPGQVGEFLDADLEYLTKCKIFEHCMS